MDRRIAADKLRTLEEQIFFHEGFSAEDAMRIADVLMQADLFGIESHGAQRMMYYHKNIASGSVNLYATPEIVRETPVSVLLDGHFAMGQLAAVKGMTCAIQKAGTCGIGIAAVRNSSHFGIAGYYTLMAERQGLAAFSMTNTGPIMVPTFGRDMMLGTNPIAFCMPADPVPFWYDASTTVVTLGKIEVHEKRQKPLPEGWVLSGNGQPQTDAASANHGILSNEPGGILPLGGAGDLLGGHKGYGLSVMVEALTGVLAQGLTCPDMQGAHGDHTCHFFLAFDPGLFGDPKDIRVRMSTYLSRLRSSNPLPGQSRIYTAGEKAFAAQEDRLANGIPLDEKTLEELELIARQFGLQPLF